jgi:hypothetical protein
MMMAAIGALNTVLPVYRLLFQSTGEILKTFGRNARHLEGDMGYIHRIAIILAGDEAQVTFRYKDYRDGGRHKSLRLSGNEFVRRFLLHILPRGSCGSATSAFSRIAVARRSFPSYAEVCQSLKENRHSPTSPRPGTS